jgi:hypothetical protein
MLAGSRNLASHVKLGIKSSKHTKQSGGRCVDMSNKI